MSSNYSRLLITTCLSMMTMSCLTLPAQAGFDWTPPEQQAAPEAEVELPKGSALPIPAPVVDEEILKTPPRPMNQNAIDATPITEEKPIKSQKPVLKTKVMDSQNQKTGIEEQTNTNTGTGKQKTFSRKNTVPSTTQKAQQSATKTITNTPPVNATKTEPSVAETGSVPRRKKPKISEKQAEVMKNQDLAAQDSAASSVQPPQMLNQNATNSAAPSADDLLAGESKPVKLEPAGGQELKINPYPTGRKINAGASNAANMGADPQSAGERALQNVYGKNDNSGMRAVTPDEQSPSGSTFSVVEGFGSDMPLALALSQIVPPSFAYSFGTGINPGQKISWNGGKPWNEVLADALSPLGITFEIQGQKLFLMKSDGMQQTNIAPSVKKKLINHQMQNMNQ